MFRTILLFGVGALLALVASTPVQAQWARTGRPIQRLDRWLGVGGGAGYHWQNPGPDVSYNNPWSELNSSLVSGYGPPPHGTPTGYRPRSNYAPQDFTPTWNQHPSNQTAPGTPTPARRPADSESTEPSGNDTGWYSPNVRQYNATAAGQATLPEFRAATPPARSTGSKTINEDWLKLPPLDSGR
jgi:hypothetical protein